LLLGRLGIALEIDRRLDGDFFCNSQQRGAELREGVLHGYILIVALPAIVLAGRGCGGRLVVGAESEISSLIGKAFFVINFHIQAHEIFLEVAVVINRARTLSLFHLPLCHFRWCSRFLVTELDNGVPYIIRY
jgi:hypothetical protein